MTARRNIIPIFIPHLGCPHNCVFCDQKRISGSLSPAGPEDVTRAIEAGLALCAEAPQAAFYGGSFTSIPAPEQEALLGAAQPYLSEGRLHALRVSTRPDAIDAPILARLRRYGVTTIELGAQSMCDRVLLASGRGHTTRDTERAAAMIRDAGFTLVLQMMTGLPGSDDEADVRSAERLIALRPDAVRLYPTVIIKGTPLFELWRAGRYREHTVEDAVRVCARILPAFEKAGIPVIRLGLNPTQALSNADAAGGAYHPALGELVKSRVLLERARALLQGLETENTDVLLGVHRSCISQLVGQHRCNLQALRQELGLHSVKVAEKELKVGEIALVSIAKSEKIK